MVRADGSPCANLMTVFAKSAVGFAFGSSTSVARATEARSTAATSAARKVSRDLAALPIAATRTAPRGGATMPPGRVTGDDDRK